MESIVTFFLVTNITTFWCTCNRSKWHIQPVSVLRKVTIFYFVGKIAKLSHILQIHLTILLYFHQMIVIELFSTIKVYILGVLGEICTTIVQILMIRILKLDHLFKIFLDSSDCRLYPYSEYPNLAWMTQIHHGA